MIEAIQIILGACTLYCFYRDSESKDDKYIFFGALGLLFVSAISIYQTITEVS